MLKSLTTRIKEAATALKKSPSRQAGEGHNLLTYDPAREIVVPKGQAIYDPKVFGRYDLASQRVVPKSSAELRPFANLDLLTAEAQRHRGAGSCQLPNDRYSLVLAELRSGAGVCLDACTNAPRQDVREAVELHGYVYQPIDIAGDGSAVLKEDLTNLTLEDNSVSAVLSVDTLEHIPDYATAIRQLYRVLADDGIAILHVPCYYFEKPFSEAIQPGIDPFGHVYYFSARDLLRVLDAAGFIVLRAHFNLDYGALLCVSIKKSSLKRPGDAKPVE